MVAKYIVVCSLLLLISILNVALLVNITLVTYAVTDWTYMASSISSINYKVYFLKLWSLQIFKSGLDLIVRLQILIFELEVPAISSETYQ